MHFLLDEIIHLSKRIDANNIADAHMAEESKAKDKAQDELLQMELDKIRREVDGRVTRKDLQSNNQTLEARLKNTEMLLKAELNEEGHAQQDYFRENFDTKDEMDIREFMDLIHQLGVRSMRDARDERHLHPSRAMPAPADGPMMINLSSLNLNPFYTLTPEVPEVACLVGMEG